MKFVYLALIGLLFFSCASKMPLVDQRQPNSIAVLDSKPWYESSKLFFSRLIKFKKMMESEESHLDQMNLAENKRVLSLGKFPSLWPSYKATDTVFIGRSTDVIKVLNDSETFSVRVYAQKMNRANGAPHMLSTDNSSESVMEKNLMHDYLRRTARVDFSTNIANDTKNEIYSKAAADRSVKLNVVDLARNVSARTILNILGLESLNLNEVIQASKISQQNYFHNLFNDPFVKSKSKKASAKILSQVEVLFDQEMNRLKKEPQLIKNNLLSIMASESFSINNKSNQGSLDKKRVIINLVGALFASIETTQSAVVHSLQFILKNKPIHELALKNIDNEKFLLNIILESLRFNPQTPMLVRYSEKDSYLDDLKSENNFIPANNLILVGIQAAMFDQNYFSEPLEFKTDRDVNKYLHFGFGPHLCLGKYINHLQLPAVLKTILSIDNLEISSENLKRTEVDFSGGPFPEKFMVNGQLK